VEVFFTDPIVPIFFVYGLAFYTMGLAVALESGGHISDIRVRRAMRVLAIFGLVHGSHEWFEMFVKIAEASLGYHVSLWVEIGRLVVLVVSFGALFTFGIQMLWHEARRANHLWGTVGILAVFGIGFAGVAMRLAPDWVSVLRSADSWARYSLGVTGGAVAGAGLLVRARDYRREGAYSVARGWLVAGGALAVYGLIGQSAASASTFFPATVYNADVFGELFGFPVQLLRAAAAVVSMAGLLSALRALELRRQQALQSANQAKLEAQARAQQEVERREALQTELLRRTVSAQEAERARIARELHDETGQTLTALNYQVAALRSSLSNGGTAVSEVVEKLNDLASQALDDLRLLVTDLRPAQLDDLGLVAAVHWLADQARERLGLDVTVTVEGRKTRLLPEVETALFRVTQEALTNVSRHANVEAAQVQLAYAESTITLEVIDEGAGFDAHELSLLTEREAWGIAGMQERAAAIGGEIDLLSAPGQGTVVRVVIPRPKDVDNDRQ
jgi:signal transduction histidine kinase